MAAAMLEEAIALGCRKFIACGGAGVLDKRSRWDILSCRPPPCAMKASRTITCRPRARSAPSLEGVAAIEQTLKRHSLPYIVGKTWTTDAPYRETAAKVQLRKSEGCLTVEMEAAAFFAVAQFRRVNFAQMLYGGDDVSGGEWDSRQLELSEPRCAKSCSGWRRKPA